MIVSCPCSQTSVIDPGPVIQRLAADGERPLQCGSVPRCALRRPPTHWRRISPSNTFPRLLAIPCDACSDEIARRPPPDRGFFVDPPLWAPPRASCPPHLTRVQLAPDQRHGSPPLFLPPSGMSTPLRRVPQGCPLPFPPLATLDQASHVQQPPSQGTTGFVLLPSRASHGPDHPLEPPPRRPTCQPTTP